MDGTNALSGVSCPAVSYCVAVDAKGNALTYNGSTWTSRDIDGTNALTAISCGSVSFCGAVDAKGNGLTFANSTWTSADADGTNSLSALSCLSSAFCVAVDGKGNDSIYSAGSWSAHNVDSTNSLAGVSCLSSTYCEAVDAKGYVLAYNGSTWSKTDIDGANALAGISCLTTTYCVAVDAKGNAITFNGATWTVKDVDSNRVAKSASCVSTAFCAVTDGSGYEVLYQPATTTYQLTWDTNGSLPLLLSDGVTSYGYGPGDEPVEESTPSSFNALYMVNSPSESAWLVVSASGAEVGYYGYDAFGNVAFGAPVTNFGFAGQYTDPATSLSYMRARWYEAQSGEFTSRDPALAVTGVPYGYAGDDPVNRFDMSGQFPSEPSNSFLVSDSSWHGYEVIPYGEAGVFGIDIETIGEVKESFRASLNGRQVQLTQSVAVLDGPIVAADLNAQCYFSDNATRTCSELYDRSDDFYENSFGYSWSSDRSSVYIEEDTGRFNVHFNLNFLAYGYPNPSQRTGRHYAPPYRTPTIICTYGTCEFYQE